MHICAGVIAAQSVQRVPPLPQLVALVPTKHVNAPPPVSPQQPPLQAVVSAVLQVFVQPFVLVSQAWPGRPTPELAPRQSVATVQPQV